MDDRATFTNEEVQRFFRGGPVLNSNAILCLIGDRIYKREGAIWRRLDNRVYRNIKELTESGST